MSAARNASSGACYANDRCAPPANVMAAQPQRNGGKQTDQQKGHHRGIGHRRQLVLRAQAFVIARPLFGDLQVLAVLGWLVAVKRHLDAAGCAVYVEVAFLPGEHPIHPVWPRNPGLLDEIERRRVPMKPRLQIRLRQSAAFLRRGARARSVLGNLVLEAHHLAGRSHIEAVLLLLLRPEPAIGPPPEPDTRSHDAVGLLEAQFAFEEGLGFVIERKTRSLAVRAGVVALFGKESPGDCSRIRAIDAKIDGCLGKGAVEVPERKPSRARQQGQADDQKAVIGAAQAIFSCSRRHNDSPCVPFYL